MIWTCTKSNYHLSCWWRWLWGVGQNTKSSFEILSVGIYSAHRDRGMFRLEGIKPYMSWARAKCISPRIIVVAKLLKLSATCQSTGTTGAWWLATPSDNCQSRNANPLLRSIVPPCQESWNLESHLPSSRSSVSQGSDLSFVPREVFWGQTRRRMVGLELVLIYSIYSGGGEHSCYRIVLRLCCVVLWLYCVVFCCDCIV